MLNSPRDVICDQYCMRHYKNKQRHQVKKTGYNYHEIWILPWCELMITSMYFVLNEMITSWPILRIDDSQHFFTFYKDTKIQVLQLAVRNNSTLYCQTDLIVFSKSQYNKNTLLDAQVLQTIKCLKHNMFQTLALATAYYKTFYYQMW